MIVKHKAILKGKHETQCAYTELTQSLSETLTTQWRQQELVARKEGGEAMQIYQVTLEKGENLHCPHLNYCSLT